MNGRILIYILIMALVTYFIRMVPFVLIRKKIKSQYIRNFLYYIPYAVLGAMTIPEIFYSTGDRITAAVGFVVAAVLALMDKSLIIVAICSCLAAYLTGLFI
ncbi:MAG: AzlD domain-containing protein [Lachnospiraceae bacterium]|nr:AzlD domain-containing protein [Lachnospiraceae bacterium]